ncbi:hypothetical protein KSB_59770 [Ktedonobacter robiniae]|uniref:Uncharacterized protein n=1 Tax=Ktedonobacter robiniae TaxID=2778365 RepID=A0ABQ3UXV8_9CHLR|nr:hypothetical protein KSB_59770 [Ktedonobacter robiniae]
MEQRHLDTRLDLHLAKGRGLPDVRGKGRDTKDQAEGIVKGHIAGPCFLTRGPERGSAMLLVWWLCFLSRFTGLAVLLNGRVIVLRFVRL